MDEYVRNTTARAFAVVASALGIPAMLPFLRAVCASKKSWQGERDCFDCQEPPLHSFIALFCSSSYWYQDCSTVGSDGWLRCAAALEPTGRMCQRWISRRTTKSNTLVFSAVRFLIALKRKVRTITALAIAALAEAATPYGIESFDDVLKPLCKNDVDRLCCVSHAVVNGRVWYSSTPWQRSGCVSQGHWLHHSADGSRVRVLLHQRGDDHSDSRVSITRRRGNRQRTVRLIAA